MLIIPTYNERENVPKLLTRIRKAVGPLPVLFIDDSSPDETANEIRTLQRTDRNVHLLLRSGRGGFASACLDGMKTVLRDHLADYVILADADLSHSPEMLPRMIQLLATHPVVIGSRYIAGGGVCEWDFFRRSLSRGANIYANFLTGVPVRDMTAGFVGYRTDALSTIVLDQIRSEGYAFQMEMKVTLYRQGIQLCEFPIMFVGRRSGKSKFDRRILLEGVRYPLTVMARRMSGLLVGSGGTMQPRIGGRRLRPPNPSEHPKNQ